MSWFSLRLFPWLRGTELRSSGLCIECFYLLRHLTLVPLSDLFCMFSGLRASDFTATGLLLFSFLFLFSIIGSLMHLQFSHNG